MAGEVPLRGRPECREALDTLYGFLDGELTEARRVQIRRHLDDCLPCLEAFDFEAELKLVVARRCRDEVPESLRIRVAMALAEASRTYHLEEGASGTFHVSEEGAGKRRPS